MTLAQQVYTQAATLCPPQEGQQGILELFCRSCVTGLQARLRPGLAAEDCLADFVASAALYALAALSEYDGTGDFSHLQLGDLTVRRSGGNAAAVCLRSQAELMMFPYVQDSFSFRGV